MGSYFHVIERKVGGNLDAFRRELGRLRESGHFHRDREGRDVSGGLVPRLRQDRGRAEGG